MINRYHSKSTENKLNLLLKKQTNIRSRILSLNDTKNPKDSKISADPPLTNRNKIQSNLIKENINFINIKSILNNP